MAAASNDVSSGTDAWPKWKFALAVGAPAAVVVLGGLWYYKNRRTSKNAKPKSGTGSKTENESTKPSSQTVPSENSTEEQKDLSPLDKSKAEKNKGNKYFKGGRYDQAIKCYTSAIEICPPEEEKELAIFYQNRAAAYEKLKRFQLVLEDCNKAIKLNKHYSKAYSRRANVCEQKGDLPQALEDVTALCYLENFRNMDALQNLERIMNELGKKRAKESFPNQNPGMPSRHYIRTYFANFMQDPVLNAVKKLDSTKAQQNGGEDIPDMNSPYHKALQKLKSEEYDDIISLCTQEIDSSQSVEARLLRATFYHLTCQFEKALEDFNKILSEENLDKKIHVNALIKRGTIMIETEKTLEGLDDFAKAVRIDPMNADVYHHRGHHNLQLSRISDAIKDLENSIEKSPEFAASHVRKSYAEHQQEKINMMSSPFPLPLPQTILTSYKQNVEMFPNYSDARVLYAQALGDAGKVEEADREFEKAIELDPENPTPYIQRGLLRIQPPDSDFEAGLNMIKKALEVDSKCEYAYEILGTIETKNLNKEKAEEYFQKAINLARTHSELVHNCTLLEAAKAQINVAKNLNIPFMSFQGPM